MNEMENQTWKREISWIKAHAGHNGNELADQNSKEAATNSDIDCYNRIPKNRVRGKLSDNSVTKRIVEWDNKTKVAITKSFFSKKAERLKFKINVTSNFTTMERKHGNIKAYLYRFKIKDNPMCSCKKGEQTIDHTLLNCEIVEQERDIVKAAVLRPENRPFAKL